MLSLNVTVFGEMGSVDESSLFWRKRKVAQFEDILAVKTHSEEPLR